MPIYDERLIYSCQMIEEAISQGVFPGAAVVIGNKDGIYKHAFYGDRCLYPERLPLYEDTLFDLSSLTKVVATTTLFMVFLEKGFLSLYDAVGEYIKGFDDPRKHEITLFHLLTHTSGLPPYRFLQSVCNGYEDSIRYISSQDLVCAPGTKVIYSDLGFILLGFILEKVGGSRLDVLCKKYVFQPLNMNSTGFCPKGENFAATEVDLKTGKAVMGICHDENVRLLGGVSGHAGLFSNMKDMSKFTSMLMNKGRFGSETFLSSAAVQSMTHNYTPNLDENRGLGWCVKGDKRSSGGDLISPTAFGHTGFTGTSIWVDRERDIYIVLLTNRIHPSRENLGIISFRRRFHNAVIASVK